jgi:hypothetical protein
MSAVVVAALGTFLEGSAQSQVCYGNDRQVECGQESTVVGGHEWYVCGNFVSTLQDVGCRAARLGALGDQRPRCRYKWVVAMAMLVRILRLLLSGYA